MKCECCHKQGFVYERKIVDEVFLLCEECDWSTEDIDAANAIGLALTEIIKMELKNGKRKSN